MPIASTRVIALSLSALLAFGTAVYAAGGNSGGGGGSSGGGSSGGGSSGGNSAGGNGGNSSPSAKKCKTGQVWNKSKKKCVAASTGVLPDAELYEQGSALAKEGHYDWALVVLDAVKDKSDPHVLNYMGYANRKAGRLEVGISFYRRALAINPDFVLAREYLGEGYVAAGRIELAKVELDEIGKRCGTSCEEYRDLANAIASAN